MGERMAGLGTVSLPCSVEELTAEWLGSALRERCPTLSVQSVEIASVIWGTATKVLVDVKYDSPPVPNGPGSKLCIKAGFVPELRAIMGLGYQREALFYRDIAPRIPTPLPRCHFAAVSERQNQGVVILDDLKSQNACFADPRIPLTPDQVARGLEVQAGWHSVTDLDDSWLHETPHIRSMIQGLFEPELWERNLAQSQSKAAHRVLADRGRVIRGFETKWSLDDAAGRCLTHGDSHVTNVYFDVSGQPFFVDWQMASMSHWANDVEMFLVGALSVDDRRTHERDLLRHYLDARRQKGGGDISLDDAWTAYCQRHLAGVTFALTPHEMQPADICDAFAERFAQAALDHRTFDLLGV